LFILPVFIRQLAEWLKNIIFPLDNPVSPDVRVERIPQPAGFGAAKIGVWSEKISFNPNELSGKSLSRKYSQIVDYYIVRIKNLFLSVLILLKRPGKLENDRYNHLCKYFHPRCALDILYNGLCFPPGILC
jgi:hypothetical protein